eukprot:1157390-Pelagomonas_calceolata.AAC.10
MWVRAKQTKPEHAAGNASCRIESCNRTPVACGCVQRGHTGLRSTAWCVQQGPAGGIDQAQAVCQHRRVRAVGVQHNVVHEKGHSRAGVAVVGWPRNARALYTRAASAGVEGSTSTTHIDGASVESEHS